MAEAPRGIPSTHLPEADFIPGGESGARASWAIWGNGSSAGDSHCLRRERWERIRMDRPPYPSWLTGSLEAGSTLRPTVCNIEGHCFRPSRSVLTGGDPQGKFCVAKCKECKWLQIEPDANATNNTMGLCIEEKFQPIVAVTPFSLGRWLTPRAPVVRCPLRNRPVDPFPIRAQRGGLPPGWQRKGDSPRRGCIDSVSPR